MSTLTPQVRMRIDVTRHRQARVRRATGPSWLSTMSMLGLALGISACASSVRHDQRAVWNELSQRGMLTRAADVVASTQGATPRLAVGHVLTLEDALRLAATRSPVVKVAMAQLGMARGEQLIASAWPNPTAEAELRRGEGGDTHLGLGASIDVTALVLRASRTAPANATLRAAHFAAAAEVARHLWNVRLLYLDAQAAAEQVRLARAANAAFTAEATTAQALATSGNLTELERLTFAAAAAERELWLADREAVWSRANEVLSLAMGLSGPELGWVIEARLPTLAEKPNNNLEEAKAISQNLQLAAAVARSESAAASVGRARAQSVLPRLAIGVHAERDHDEWSVGPSAAVTVPLFDWGQGQRATAHAAMDGARADATQWALRIRGAARQARIEQQAAYVAAARYQNELVPMRTAAVGETVKLYNAMMLSVFDVLRARQAELATQQAEIDARHRALRANIMMEALAAGVLLEADPVAARFDASTNAGNAGGDAPAGGGHHP